MISDELDSFLNTFENSKLNKQIMKKVEVIILEFY